MMSILGVLNGLNASKLAVVGLCGMILWLQITYLALVAQIDLTESWQYKRVEVHPAMCQSAKKKHAPGRSCAQAPCPWAIAIMDAVHK